MRKQSFNAVTTARDLTVPRSRRSRAGVHYDPHAFARLAEAISRTLGTARFLIWQTIFFVAWIVANVAIAELGWDPYPFLLLTMVMSLQAAYAAPLILLGQRRQEDQDRRQTTATGRAPSGPSGTRSSSPESSPGSEHHSPTLSPKRTSNRDSQTSHERSTGPTVASPTSNISLHDTSNQRGVGLAIESAAAHPPNPGPQPHQAPDHTPFGPDRAARPVSPDHHLGER